MPMPSRIGSNIPLFDIDPAAQGLPESRIGLRAPDKKLGYSCLVKTVFKACPGGIRPEFKKQLSRGSR